MHLPRIHGLDDAPLCKRIPHPCEYLLTCTYNAHSARTYNRATSTWNMIEIISCIVIFTERVLLNNIIRREERDGECWKPCFNSFWPEKFYSFSRGMRDASEIGWIKNYRTKGNARCPSLGVIVVDFLSLWDALVTKIALVEKIIFLGTTSLFFVKYFSQCRVGFFSNQVCILNFECSNSKKYRVFSSKN